MSPLSSLLKRLRSIPTEVRECRNCGTTLDDEQTVCPDCGREEVATYRLTE